MIRMLLMLPNKFEMPLDLDLKPSHILLGCFYICVFLGMLGIALSSALPIAVRLLLFFILLIYAYYLHQDLSLPVITTLHLKTDNSWELSIRSKEQVQAELYGECIVTYLLIWLNFRTSTGEKYHLLLLRDSAEQENLRWLRVRLRFM